MPLIESTFSALILWGLIGYVLGSVPYGLILARVLNLGNLREIGSGSIGATNVLRTGSKSAAALTLLLDAGKGAAAVILARMLASEDAAQLAGFAAMVGHCYPVWLKFNGGKGVATYLGLMLALSLPLGVACCLAWLAVAALTRISSASSLGSALASPVLAVAIGLPQLVVLCIALAAVILWRHRANIVRLRAGTEPKIGKKT